MSSFRPHVTGTAHPLPFADLPPLDFERLSFWLVRRESYENVEHDGAAGQDDGCDLSGFKNGERVVFQCKRMPRLTPKQAEAAVDKILALPSAERPVRIVLAVAGSISKEAKRRARERAKPLSVEFWDRTALEERVYRGGPSVLSRFFQIGTPSPSLPLTLYRNQRVSLESAKELGEAAALLSPYAFSIPLIGRQVVLAELQSWLNGEAPVSIRVMTAKGGAGKTRLALELCEAAVKESWEAGFLKEIPEPLGDWGWSGPTLVVVDYVASRATQLRAWLAEVADRLRDREHALRILLLERHADPDSGWWRGAFGFGGGEARAIQELLDPPAGPFELPPLVGQEERRRVIAAILERAGSAVRPPTEGGLEDFDRKLAQISWGGEPLFLLMAGLVAARAGFGAVLALSATDLGLEIAKHEVARIERIAKSEKIPERLFSHLAAYVTLCGGLSREQLELIVEEEKAALGYRSAGDAPEIAEALAVAFPGKPGEIAPVLPDIVGEAVALLALGAVVEAKASAAVSRAVSTHGDRVTATLIRLAQDYGAARPEPLSWFERLVEERAVDLDSLEILLRQLPESTLVLRERAATLTAQAVGLAREGGGRKKLATGLNNLSNRLADLGRREEALVAIQEAVEIRQDLAAAQPDAFRPDLARSLNNLSNRLANLGRWKEALLAIQQAVEIYRDLASARPDAFRPDLASLLNNLSNRLANLGRREEALMAIQQAVEIRRDLAATRPDAFRPDLARSLNNLSNRLANLGRWKEALLAIQQAVEIYRDLAAARPDAFRPDLASLLNNLSNRLAHLGRREEALVAIQQAVEIRRDLAATRPDAFRPNLAKSLGLMAVILRELGQAENAFQAIDQAFRTLAPYFLAFPDTFQRLMRRMMREYLNNAEAAGCEPDLELLEPIQKALAGLEKIQ